MDKIELGTRGGGGGGSSSHRNVVEMGMEWVDG